MPTLYQIMYTLRRAALPILLLLTCGWHPSIVVAQNAKNTPAVTAAKIAILTSQDMLPYEQVLKGFEDALQQHGLHITLTTYALQGDIEKAALYLQAIKHQGAHLVFTLGSLATQETIQSGLDIPVLAGMVLNKTELEQTANATGVVLDFSVETQFQWLQRFLPDYKTVGVIFNPAENQDRINIARQTAQRLGITLIAQAVQTPQDLPDALDSLSRRADVLWGIADTIVMSPQTAKPLLLFSFRNRIPFIGLSASWVKAGALYSLDRDYVDLGRQCADMAAKIIQGTHTHDLPPASPRKVTYALNMKTARHMKLTVSDPLVQGAQQLFK